MTNIPPGYCQCGCGQRTSIVTQNDPARGYKKGDYKRYVNFHHNNKNHLTPKKCAVCGKEFLPKRKNRQETQLTCSARCRNVHNSRKTAEQRSITVRNKKPCAKSYPKYHGKHYHRIVMEQKLGRQLKPGEIVHHKDEDKQNYNPDNLILFASQREHTSYHSTKYHAERRAN